MHSSGFILVLSVAYDPNDTSWDRELQGWWETNVRYSEMAKIVITKVDLKVSLA